MWLIKTPGSHNNVGKSVNCVQKKKKFNKIQNTGKMMMQRGKSARSMSQRLKVVLQEFVKILVTVPTVDPFVYLYFSSTPEYHPRNLSRLFARRKNKIKYIFQSPVCFSISPVSWEITEHFVLTLSGLMTLFGCRVFCLWERFMDEWKEHTLAPGFCCFLSIDSATCGKSELNVLIIALVKSRRYLWAFSLNPKMTLCKIWLLTDWSSIQIHSKRENMQLMSWFCVSGWRKSEFLLFFLLYDEEGDGKQKKTRLCENANAPPESWSAVRGGN